MDGVLVLVGGVEAEDGVAVGGFDLVSVYVVVWTSKFRSQALEKSKVLGAFTMLMVLRRDDQRDGR